MLNDQSLAVVNRLAEVLGESGDKITAEYTRHVIAEAVIWLLVFTTLLALSWTLHATTPDWRGSEGDELAFCGVWMLKLSALIAEAVALGTNVPSLLAPKAVAIDKLISSLPGHGG